MLPPDSWLVRGLLTLEEKSFDRTTGNVPVGSEKGSKVISKESQGHEDADHGAAGLKDGMDRHEEQLLSNVVSYS